VEGTRERANGSQEVMRRVAMVAAPSFSTDTVRSERKPLKYGKRCTPFPPTAFLAISSHSIFFINPYCQCKCNLDGKKYIHVVLYGFETWSLTLSKERR
jgi:hypothetical protein